MEKGKKARFRIISRTTVTALVRAHAVEEEGRDVEAAGVSRALSLAGEGLLVVAVVIATAVVVAVKIVTVDRRQREKERNNVEVRTARERKEEREEEREEKEEVWERGLGRV